MAIIGIDAGATWIKAATVNGDMSIARRVKVASGAGQGWARYLDSIKEAVDLLGEDGPVGLALPAVFTSDRSAIKYFCNAEGARWDDAKSVNELFKESLGGRRVVADNDASLATLAEWKMGGGDISQSWLHLTWGTGIGTGFVAGGVLQPGWEAGHMPVSWESGDAECGCGSRIDLESRAAVPAMVGSARMELEKGQLRTSLTLEDFRDSKKTSKRLIELAMEDDELAKAVVCDALLWLARGILQMSAISMPDVITLGGAAFESDWPIDTVKDFLRQEASGFLGRMAVTDITRRGVWGNDAGVIGAAMLIELIS